MKNIERWNSYMTVRSKIDIKDLVRIIVNDHDYNPALMEYFNITLRFADYDYLDIKLLSNIDDTSRTIDKMVAIAELSDCINILKCIPYACRDTFVIDVDEYDTTPFGVSLTIEAAGYRIIEEIILS